MRAITPDDGWCDSADHALYNHHFTISKQSTLPTSFEYLWRADHAYDVVVVLGYNDAPAIPGKGSAIFMHLNHDDGRPTAGCVAMEKEELLALLERCSSDSILHISPNEIFIE